MVLWTARHLVNRHSRPGLSRHATTDGSCDAAMLLFKGVIVLLNSEPVWQGGFAAGYCQKMSEAASPHRQLVRICVCMSWSSSSVAWEGKSTQLCDQFWETASRQASQRCHVACTYAWQNAFHRFARCYERRATVVDASSTSSTRSSA